MADYNQALSVADALERGRALDAESIYWIEEPIRHDDYAGCASLARALTTPIQIGENFSLPVAMETALKAGAADYLQRLSNGLRMLSLDPARSQPNECTELKTWWADAGPMLKNALPRGVPESEAVWRIIVDPIDGTRGLMYQKRSAWILTGVAPNRGPETNLQDIELAMRRKREVT